MVISEELIRKVYKKRTLDFYVYKALFYKYIFLLKIIAYIKGHNYLNLLWSRLVIELHSDCNRDCNFCPRYNDSSGIRKDKNGNHVKKQMPTWKIKDIIDQAAELGFHGNIGFHRLSEPFLDDRYVEVATYAKEKGMIIRDHTNADNLKNNPDLIKQIDNLVDWLGIGLYDYKNEKEKFEQMEFWKKQFKKTKIDFSLAKEYPGNRINSILERDNNQDNLVINFPCLWPMRGLWIRYDGEVSLCCEDDQCKFDIGNIFKNSIKDIWLSKKRIKIVNNLMKFKGRSIYELCKKCCYIGYIPSKDLNKKFIETH